MLYDRRWEVSPQNFLSFLESKPENECFNYRTASACAIGQYAASKGESYWTLCGEGGKLVGLNMVMYHCSRGTKRTFGMAAKALRKWLADAK